MAGTAQQLEQFTERTAIYRPGDAPVLILGGGRVGRAAADAGSPFTHPERSRRTIAFDPGHGHGSTGTLDLLWRRVRG